MDLDPYVVRLRRELAVAAEAGGDEVRAVAERLIAPLDSAVRLVLLEALADAAGAITRDLAPGSVHLRLRGREPDFVVTPARGGEPVHEHGTVDPSAPEDSGLTDGPVSRINFRPPEKLKARIEEAAAAEALSVNTWLVRAVSSAFEPRGPVRRPTPGGNHFTGWVG